MSALARFVTREGNKVSGYDREQTELTKKLEAEGIRIHYVFDESELTYPIDKVVYTPAIKSDQREFQYFLKLGIPMLKRSELLKEILDQKKVIAIAGTHGKTSTSAMLTHVMHQSNREVTGFIGGIMKNYNSNFIYGSGNWVIVEADEYDRSFLRLFPHIALIQAIDADHLDIYGTEEEMVSAYRSFTMQIRKGGKLFIQKDVAQKRLTDEWRTGLKERDISICEIEDVEELERHGELWFQNGMTRFNLPNSKRQCSLIMPGIHNVRNALGAIAIARNFELSDASIAAAISGFDGILRRFEYVVRNEDLIIIDDYAHHPKEIDAALEAARRLHPGIPVTIVFQPHLYSRTRDFLHEFAESLSKADEIILTELYPAREKPIKGINSKSLLTLIEVENKQLVDKTDLVRFLSMKNRPLILFLGAGDVYKHLEEIKHALTA